jgi:hypothetical protein
MSETEHRRPYVVPRLLTVQPRMPGDQLATGCKDAGGGPGGGDCELQTEACHYTGS